MTDSQVKKMPDPRLRNPLVFPNGAHDPATVFLSQVIDHPNIDVGDWSYYNDQRLLDDYASTLAPYLFAGAAERLVIGKFCQIAQGVEFITASANHAMSGISTYPFSVFDQTKIAGYRGELPRGFDTIIGHDCWIGRGATLLPGAELGCGVIVGAKAVVRGKIPDYAIVAGNPAVVVRMRFDAGTVAQLLEIAWWDWDANKIAAQIDLITSGDVGALSEVP